MRRCSRMTVKDVIQRFAVVYIPHNHDIAGR
jgi:hypothetical protein